MYLVERNVFFWVQIYHDGTLNDFDICHSYIKHVHKSYKIRNMSVGSLIHIYLDICFATPWKLSIKTQKQLHEKKINVTVIKFLLMLYSLLFPMELHMILRKEALLNRIRQNKETGLTHLS